MPRVTWRFEQPAATLKTAVTTVLVNESVTPVTGVSGHTGNGVGGGGVCAGTTVGSPVGFEPGIDGDTTGAETGCCGVAGGETMTGPGAGSFGIGIGIGVGSIGVGVGVGVTGDGPGPTGAAGDVVAAPGEGTTAVIPPAGVTGPTIPGPTGKRLGVGAFRLGGASADGTTTTAPPAPPVAGVAPAIAGGSRSCDVVRIAWTQSTVAPVKAPQKAAERAIQRTTPS